MYGTALKGDELVVGDWFGFITKLQLSEDKSEYKEIETPFNEEMHSDHTGGENRCWLLVWVGDHIYSGGSTQDLSVVNEGTLT